MPESCHHREETGQISTLQKLKSSVTASSFIRQALATTATGKEGRPSMQASVRRLTPAQVEEYKNMCLKCDEPFTFDHKCKSKSIMLIESEGLEDNSEEEGDEEILLEPQGQKEYKKDRVISPCHGWNSSPKIIRLLGQVNRKPVSILLDTGSTHNFIDLEVVQRTGLQIIPEPPFNVTVARGDKLHSEGLCKSVHIKCQGADIVSDFHILPIGGC